MSFPKSVRSVEIEQQVRYGFTKEFVESLCAKDAVRQYAWALHDKDNEDHIHCMLWFHNPIPTDSILKWIEGVGTINQLEKIKKDESACAYLTHANKPDKVQYDVSIVHTNIKDFEGITERQRALANIQPLIDNILSGKLTEKQFYNGTYGDIYVKHKRKIDIAFDYYYDSKRKEVLSMEQDIVVVFVDGDSRTGKTSYIVDQCKALGYSYCKSSSSNDILQDYVDEDVLILDDLRDDALKLSDFLKFTDPHVRSTTQSRYHNKCFVGKVIYITTTKPLDAWYEGSKNKEQIVQFTARIHQHWHFTKDDIEFYSHKDGIDTNEFILDGVYPNIMKDKYKETRNKSIDMLTALRHAIDQQKAIDKPAGFVAPSDDDDLPFI